MKAFSRILFCVFALAAARAEDFQGASHKVDYEGELLKYGDQTSSDPVAQLQHRLANCMQCHGSNRTLGVPGHVVRSVGTDLTGELDSQNLLERLHAILTGEDHDPQFAKIRPEDRQAILEIVRETKSNLPDHWKS